MIRRLSFLLSACLLASPAVAKTAAPADPADTILQKAVNQFGTHWELYGPGQTNEPMKDAGVPGGEVIRVTVSAKTPNPWDIGALSPIQKPIAAGDTILIAVYLRAPELKDGETVTIPFLGANEGVEPFGTLVSSEVAVSKEWKLYYASGKAPRAYAAGGARATVHLGAAKQVIDLGPIFVLDFGPNYGPEKLPKN